MNHEILTHDSENGAKSHLSGSLGPLVIGALGVVYGDIGTSPLYTMKTALDWGGGATPQVALGMLSLIVWTLIVITSIKYVALIMRADNKGEGGILALMSLLGRKGKERLSIITLGLLGASLLYGDGAITPAISVLSALEGLKDPMPSITPFVLPMAVMVLLGLFLMQRYGTASIGLLFGPIMAVWFVVIGLLGLAQILQHPSVLAALNPLVGLTYLAEHGLAGITVLGAVFLAVTGAEALYADMGHFGAFPIRLGWYALVLPSLVLCYAGQAALVVGGALPDGDNPFFVMVPEAYRLPMVILATVATIIASQAIISGVFSMTRQAIQLGFLPRMTITQTSDQGYGQIYVAAINWILMVFTIGLTVVFGSSDRLAAAYGVAVALTMLLTTSLMFVLMRKIWKWSLVACVAVAGTLALVDLSFVAANLTKVLDGGWVPLAAATTLFYVMICWHRGRMTLIDHLKTNNMSIGSFISSVSHVHRVAGTAVYLNRRQGIATMAMLHNLKHYKTMHERNLVVHVETEHVPRIARQNRVIVRSLGEGFWAIDIRYGFMEHPNLPKVLANCVLDGKGIDMIETTFFISRETIGRAKDSPLDPISHRVYEFLHRNAGDASAFFRIPPGRMVELGASIEI